MIAFIFARGGSKGLPGKNIALLAGKPLLVHAIECALQSRYIDKVVVSTDCQEIADVAFHNGAEIIDRPAKLATDESPEWLSWQHALSVYPATEIFVSCPATSPLRIPQDIDHTIEAAQDNEVALTVAYARNHPFGEPSLRRQDRQPRLDVAGSCYALKADFIRNHQNIWESQNIAVVPIPQERHLDIDTAWDFRLAELIKTHC